MLSTRWKRVVAAAAAAALAALSACTGSPGGGDPNVFKIWHYESPNSAMAIAWNEAIQIFEDEHPDVTVQFEERSFEQIQQTAGMILSSNEAPSILEYNKGNATAGLLSSQGLLTDLTSTAQERGWQGMLPESIATTAMYDENGVMGSGNWYGIPNYGEFVTVYYNRTMFDEAGVEIPTTLAEFEQVLAAFQTQGVTPIGMAGAEYPAMQLMYQLSLSRADRDWISAFQMYTGEVDFQDEAWTYGAQTFSDWVAAGYIPADSASLTAEDMGVAFINGTYPIIVSGSWWYGRFDSEITNFEWGIFNFPGNTYNAGSSGNLWVVPANNPNPELAYDFIDITMRPEIQAILGNNGGLPVAANEADITDERSLELVAAFNEVLDADGLAFYPDWPVPGYYDVMANQVQRLINQSATPEQVLTDLGSAYDEGRPNQ